jgi:branched-chain amino acid transport system ATP-binding protein
MRTFQNLQLFPGMSVLENVLLGAHCHLRSDLVEALFHLQRGRKEDVSAIHTAHEVLAFTRIDHLSHATASSLPYGHQRLLEIARALAGKPRLLLLDEPAAGMNPAEKQNLLDLLRRIQERGATILLVEHDMRLVMQVCSQISVLNFGRKLCDGAPEEVQRDAAVISAYLGAGGSGGAAGGLDLEAGNAGTS